MGRPVTTVRRYRLGTELRRLREQAKVTQEVAGEVIDADDSKVSRVEQGKSPISRPQLVELLKLYGLKERDRRYTALINLNKESRKKGWWQQQGDLVPPTLQELIDLESSASRIFCFESSLVPGLLQTKEYATAMIGGFPLAPGVSTVEQAVGVRMKRQDILVGEEAPQLICVLDESALRRCVDSPSIMGAQLRKLADVNNPPHLTIQVVPYANGVHAGMDGPFQLYSYPEPSDMDIAFVDYKGGRVFVEESSEVAPFRLASDHLRAQALSSDASVELISAIARGLERS
ncbi:helix-turn-helix transcriptional regulator [Streptomyces pathocidini]|uniref:helix-turn-helix domain-containing protein n=1 Tax=Streptomyces pathocidini TaxID=1650571 RepID=UPI003403B529